MANETETLLSYLNHQRDHVLGILEGLSGEDLLKPVLPTGWTCLGLVQHLTFDIEQFWFRRVVAGESIEPDEMGDDPAAAWKVSASVAPDAVFARYRLEAQRADAIVAATSPDAEPAAWPEDLFPHWRLPDLRAITLHVIAETACHAGHLDAARELLDGRTWLILTG